ncbi:hypothetical protein KVR01_010814 [Diaporthe batatas]|uniref:uncharacterized protein n=1 Tax=Diaporthe batatas TaxID=748121 RepID=UPI001D05A4E6|nr:uncharacterized protein KVR01_010814 [Diaporthe batatas]KAG8159153.1 hypothetical protein KVR01_010814 [Diaporthe batatas]
MAKEKVVVPTKDEIRVLGFNSEHTHDLIRQAQEADSADRQLTIKEAIKKYKKACFWAMILSTSLVMEGYDLVIINSFYGQTQFQNRFGTYDAATDTKVITAQWQSVLSNSAVIGQLVGLAINTYAQDKFGCRRTMMTFMVWMLAAICMYRSRPYTIPKYPIFVIWWYSGAEYFLRPINQKINTPCLVTVIPFFAPSLSVLAFGEFICGIPWGVFQTLSTSYASEVVPTILRPYVTAYVCMCWGGGILLSSGVVRAVVNVEGDLGWRLPFALQWVWPIPLFIAAYLAPESPWNCVRRGKMEEARQALTKLRQDTPGRHQQVEYNLAYITYTTELEKAETENASFADCFKGTNLRRTEINCVVWAAQILCGNAVLGFSVVFLEAAGFNEVQAFDLNISLSACYIVGGAICWLLMPRLGRATLYMGGMTFMFFCLVAIGGLGFYTSQQSQLAIGILLVMSTLANMTTIGPVCYPIVAETPSGRLRYKTITIGRFVYNVTGIFSNSVTPRMISATAWNWGAKAGLFYAGTNLLCNIWCWFRLPETKGRTFGEIDLMFDNHVPARKFKYTTVDQFAVDTSAKSVAGSISDKHAHDGAHIEHVS